MKLNKNPLSSRAPRSFDKDAQAYINSVRQYVKAIDNLIIQAEEHRRINNIPALENIEKSIGIITYGIGIPIEQTSLLDALGVLEEAPKESSIYYLRQSVVGHLNEVRSRVSTISESFKEMEYHVKENNYEKIKEVKDRVYFLNNQLKMPPALIEAKFKEILNPHKRKPKKEEADRLF